MPWNLLLLPLISGYYILTRFYPFKYRQQRLDRQRLIFESILISVVFSVIIYLIRIIIENYNYQFCNNMYIKIPFKTPFLGTSLVILVSSILLTEIVNIFLDKEKYINKAIKSVGNEFELLLRSSFEYKKMLQVSLKNGKVYIVWVKELPIPTISNYIRVIPLVSGYRNNEMEVIYTTHYLKVYAEYIEEGVTSDIEELDIDLVINIGEIVNISYFDSDMHKRFNRLKDKNLLN